MFNLLLINMDFRSTLFSLKTFDLIQHTDIVESEYKIKSEIFFGLIVPEKINTNQHIIVPPKPALPTQDQE